MDYAVKMSNKMAKNRNKHAIDETKTIDDADLKPNRHTVTNLVSRKRNFKECALYMKLVNNISDHLQNTHKLDSKQDIYSECLIDSKVVPNCYLTYEDGKPRKITGSELKETEKIYESTVQQQRESLEKLKARIETNSLKEKINNSPAYTNKAALKQQ